MFDRHELRIAGTPKYRSDKSRELVPTQLVRRSDSSAQILAVRLAGKTGKTRLFQPWLDASLKGVSCSISERSS